MRTRWIRALMLASGLAFLAFVPGCWDDDDDDDGNGNANPLPSDSLFKDSALVSDTSLYGAKRIDHNLSNPWGMVMADGDHFWVANNHTGTVTIYNGSGDSTGPAIPIPGEDSAEGGVPTGMVKNSTEFFRMPNGGGAAQVLFAGEDGTISAWHSGTEAAVVVTDTSEDAVFKGLTIAMYNGMPFLYVANFGGGKVNVYDTAFHMDTAQAFEDTTLPDGYAPFNIALVDTLLYVTYAKQGPDGEDDESGPGNGFINVFTTKGEMVRRFASQGALNSPWGMTKSTGDFGRFKDALFVGNFGDGHILAYDTSGTLIGEVLGQDNQPVTIEGLWEILWVPSGMAGGVSGNSIFYTAGPNDEEDGVFGYLINP